MAMTFNNVRIRRFRTRLALRVLLVVGSTLALDASSVLAGLVVNNWDARATYPASAPVYTSILPYFNTQPVLPTAGSQGVRSDRTQIQSFDVASAISVQSIYMGYRLQGVADPPNNVRIRLLSLPDVNSSAGASELLSITITTPTPWNGQATSERYRALRLDWVDTVPLILSPQAGTAGYAIELLGANATGSPIAWIFRTDNPYSAGRAFTLSDASITANHDWVLAITGSLVPEPTAFVAWGLCAALGSVAMARHRFGESTGSLFRLFGIDRSA